MKITHALAGLFALAIIVLAFFFAPSITRKIDGTDAAYRTQVALELDNQRFNQQLAQTKASATAPASVAIPYMLVAALGGALTIGGLVAYQRLYKSPLIRADSAGRLPIARRVVADVAPSNDQALMIIMQSMQQATAVQIETVRAMQRIADKVDMKITVSDRAPAPASPQALPDSPAAAQLPEPVFSLTAGRLDLLSRLATTGADSLLLGMDDAGNEVRGDLSTLMHTGLLAQTGGGKTTTLAAYGLQLAGDPRVRLAIADPHMMELALLEDTGAFWKSAPTNARQAVAILTDTAKEITRRAELVNRVATHVQNQTGRRVVLNTIDRYNVVAARCKAEQLPSLVVFADEIKALAAMGDEADSALNRITAEGRKFGVYLVGASQSWKADVVNSDIRSQFWTRIALYGAAFRQVAELFECTQPEAKAYTAQLLAPGCAAIWRRGSGVQVLKTPYIDMESDAVYGAMELIRTRRSAGRSAHEAPTIRDVTPAAPLPATPPAPFDDVAFQSPKPALLPADLPSIEMPSKKTKVVVSDEERQRILTAASGAVSRRGLCKTLFEGATGGAPYEKIKLVCDEAGLLA